VLRIKVKRRAELLRERVYRTTFAIQFAADEMEIVHPELLAEPAGGVTVRVRE
jgi:hypothetical protein